MLEHTFLYETVNIAPILRCNCTCFKSKLFKQRTLNSEIVQNGKFELNEK